MDKHKNLKIGIWILSAIVVMQWIFIIAKPVPKKVPKIPLVVKGKIAIVIDDWGYQSAPLVALAGLGFPITTAILPNLAFSTKAAEASYTAGHEVILHCPMQAKGKRKAEKGTLKAHMGADEALAL